MANDFDVNPNPCDTTPDRPFDWACASQTFPPGVSGFTETVDFDADDTTFVTSPITDGWHGIITFGSQQTMDLVLSVIDRMGALPDADQDCAWFDQSQPALTFVYPWRGYSNWAITGPLTLEFDWDRTVVDIPCDCPGRPDPADLAAGAAIIDASYTTFDGTPALIVPDGTGPIVYRVDWCTETGSTITRAVKVIQTGNGLELFSFPDDQPFDPTGWDLSPGPCPDPTAIALDEVCALVDGTPVVVVPIVGIDRSGRPVTITYVDPYGLPVVGTVDPGPCEDCCPDCPDEVVRYTFAGLLTTDGWSGDGCGTWAVAGTNALAADPSINCFGTPQIAGPGDVAAVFNALDPNGNTWTVDGADVVAHVPAGTGADYGTFTTKDPAQWTGTATVETSTAAARQSKSIATPTVTKRAL